MRFRKKPIIVEAAQFWNDKPWPNGVCDCGKSADHYGTPHIHTLEGIMDVTEGDWIVTGVNVEVYPVKPDIFAKTYEPVPDELVDPYAPGPNPMAY